MTEVWKTVQTIKKGSNSITYFDCSLNNKKIRMVQIIYVFSTSKKIGEIPLKYLPNLTTVEQEKKTSHEGLMRDS